MRFNVNFGDLKDKFKVENRIAFHAKGKRSFVYKAFFSGKAAAVKVERKGISAKNRISNEIKWLKRLNKYGIGPKLIGYGNDFFICEFVSGKVFHEWLADAGKEAAKSALTELLKQCRQLDKLNVSKEELHHPVKHIIIRDSKPVMIDFERCHSTERPKNVTQFCQFLLSDKVLPLLLEKGFIVDSLDVRKMLKAYKKGYSSESFKAILNRLGL